MATDEPVTVWQPTSGNGEMSQQGLVNLITIGGRFLTTLGGLYLILDYSVYSIIAPTIWAENDGM